MNKEVSEEIKKYAKCVLDDARKKGIDVDAILSNPTKNGYSYEQYAAVLSDVIGRDCRNEAGTYYLFLYPTEIRPFNVSGPEYGKQETLSDEELSKIAKHLLDGRKKLKQAVASFKERLAHHA